MADEALLSFQSLLQCVPGWISDLETILTTATQQQIVLAAERAADEEAVLAHQQRGLTPFDFLRLAQRKRKTASVCSRADSRSSVEVSRRQFLATIYYDGTTQKRFESLVRAIGSSRNLIRKGKLGMKLDSMTRSGSSSSSCSSEGEETIKGLGTFSYKTTTTMRRSPMGDRSSTAMFDKIDHALDNAQIHCERAAHQILRQGDCSTDVCKARRHFQEAITVMEAELPALEKKAAKSIQRKVIEDEKYALEEQRSFNVQGHILLGDGSLEVDTDECTDSESDMLVLSTLKAPLRQAKQNTIGPQPDATIMSI